MIVYCATSNPGKLREFQLAAPDFDVRPLPAKAPPPEEHGATFEENAVAKAEYYGKLCRTAISLPTTPGLEVDALGRRSGRAFGSLRGTRGHRPGQQRAAAGALEQASPNRTARFVCVIALVKNGTLMKTFRGAVEGRILEMPAARAASATIRCFTTSPSAAPSAKRPSTARCKVSHRAQALEAMFAFLRNTAST